MRLSSLISDSIVIGFWVGLAVFVFFTFFVLALLTKTRAPPQAWVCSNFQPMISGPRTASSSPRWGCTLTTWVGLSGWKGHCLLELSYQYRLICHLLLRRKHWPSARPLTLILHLFVVSQQSAWICWQAPPSRQLPAWHQFSTRRKRPIHSTLTLQVSDVFPFPHSGGEPGFCKGNIWGRQAWRAERAPAGLLSSSPQRREFVQGRQHGRISRGGCKQAAFPWKGRGH